jgi:type VI secretion system lysozyme-like protein
MGREQSLLERIAARGGMVRARHEPSASENIDELLASVRRQLKRLLNARHGMSEALPDYGLPALTDLTVGTGDYVNAVLRAIRTAVEKYEPRLRRVQVKRVDDPEEGGRTLTFRIDAVLHSQTGQHRVWYQTELDPGGQFAVSE